MGTLRLILALWVVMNHGARFFGAEVPQGWIAVQLFFIISGFYMSLILNEKYLTSQSNRLFYTNRFFRIFPVFWLVIVLSLAAIVTAWWGWNVRLFPLQTWVDHQSVLGWHNLPLLIGCQLTLFGQGGLMYLGFDPADGHLFPTAHFSNHDPQVWHFMVMPQAWTIELELLFYVLAPYLVRRPAKMIAWFIGGSLVLRAMIYVTVGHKDPWSHRFFPTELALFLGGTLAYRIYRSPWREHWQAHRGIKPALIALLGLVSIFPFIPVNGMLKAWALYPVFVVALPFLFAWTQAISWDREIGELSFPVYLLHFVIVVILEKTLPPGLDAHRSLVAVAVSLAASWLLLKGFIDPLERWRHARR